MRLPQVTHHVWIQNDLFAHKCIVIVSGLCHYFHDILHDCVAYLLCAIIITILLSVTKCTPCEQRPKIVIWWNFFFVVVHVYCTHKNDEKVIVFLILLYVIEDVHNDTTHCQIGSCGRGCFHAVAFFTKTAPLLDPMQQQNCVFVNCLHPNRLGFFKNIQLYKFF